MSVEYGDFFDQRRGHQLEPDLSEEVSARLRLGSGSNGLLRRKMSILETKEKNCSGKERDKRTEDLLELTEVLFLLLIGIRGIFFNDFYFFHFSWFTVFCQFSAVQQSDPVTRTYITFFFSHYPPSCSIISD